MSAEKFFTYRPERIFWCGFLLLSVLIGCVAALVGLPQMDETPRWSEPKRGKEVNKEFACLHVALSQSAGEVWSCPIPDLQRQVAFSLDPSRPDEANQSMQVSIRLKDSSSSQRFEVPCSIPLIYRNGILAFGTKGSPFRLELFRDREVLMGQVFVDDRSGEPFRLLFEENPIQTAQEFSENSPFRQLALGRWWGADLFYQTYIEEVLKHRIDLGSPLEARLIDVKVGDWLAFLEGEWKEISHVEEAQKGCIARVLSSSPSGLLIEGWEENRHIRLCLPEAAPLASKIKVEELFGSIRIRSDKQISCLLDKQCLIIKVNDWVVKTSDRWKILRKAEEKEAFLKGKLVGELFVLDQISNKQGQKSILGHMYNLARTQMTAVDVPVLGRRPASAYQQNSSELKGKVR
jgi:hypothetical protein